MSKLPLRILVTGGAGYIGSHVVLELLDSGFAVVVLDDLSNGFECLIDKRAIFEQGDFGNKKQVLAIIDKYSFAGVIHLAASNCVVSSLVDRVKFDKNNVDASVKFFEILRSKKIPNFVFSSSAAVFGNVAKEQIPITESCAKNPISLYGLSKLLIENGLNNMANFYNDFRFVILRYFNACGADLNLRSGECHQDETHLIPLALQTALGRRRELEIFGDDFATSDGSCIRDYIHVSDLARIHVLAIKYLLNGGASDSFNCGYKGGFSVKQIVKKVEEITGKKITAKIIARRQGDPDILIADNTKLVDRLGFQPQFDDIDLIIKSAYDWEVKKLQSDNYFNQKCGNNMTYFYKNITSPVGQLKLVASDVGLVAILWQNDKIDRVKLEEMAEDKNHAVILQTEKELAEYFAGKRQVFSVNLDFIGSQFQKKVWAALLTIPFGETRSYGEIAKQIGNIKAARAVGAASGKNPIVIIAPCHRVIGASGKLTGFAGGLEAKSFLLNLEK